MHPTNLDHSDVSRARWIEARIDITDRCNLQCPHCARHARPPGSGHEMEATTFQRIASQVFPFAHTVHLACAGEPLMSPLFEEAVRTANRYSVRRICLVTNGALLNEKRARFCLDQAVAEFTFSIESSRPELFAMERLGTTLQALMTNVDRLRDLRDSMGLSAPSIHFNVIILRRNLDELREIAEWCRAHGGERVRFGLLVIDNEAMREEAPVRHPMETNRAIEELRSHVDGWSLNVDLPPKLNAGRSFKRCAQAWTGLFISVHGEVWPCFRLQGMPFGDLATRDLDDIIRDATWTRLRWEHAAGQLRWQCHYCTETGNDHEACYENPLWLVPDNRRVDVVDPKPPEDPIQVRIESTLVHAIGLRFEGDLRASDASLFTLLGAAGDPAEWRPRLTSTLSRAVHANTAWMLGRLMEQRYETESTIKAYRRFLELCEHDDARRSVLGPWLDRVEVEHELATARRELVAEHRDECLLHLRRALAIDPGVDLMESSVDGVLTGCLGRLVADVRFAGTLLGIADVALVSWNLPVVAAAFERYLELAPHETDSQAVRRALASLDVSLLRGNTSKRNVWADRLRTAFRRRFAASPRVPLAKPTSPRSGLSQPRGLTLRMDVTNRCNMRCIQCCLEQNRREQGEAPADMSLRLFRRIVAEVLPFCERVALSCEAEPTLHPEIEMMLRLATRVDGPEVLLTTNGMALTDRLLATMLDAPLAGLNVSIDGASNETFGRIRRGGTLDRVGRALDRLAKMKSERDPTPRLVNPRLQINVTLMRSNLHELPAIAALAHRWEAFRLTLQHVYAFELNGLAAESLALDPFLSDSVILETAALCRSYGIETTFPPLFSRSDPTPAPAAGDNTLPACQAPWRIVRIWWNGLVYPCDLWGRGAPAMGDLQRQRFLDIWNGPAYRSLRSGLSGQGKLHDACSRCTMVTTDNLEHLCRRPTAVITLHR